MSLSFKLGGALSPKQNEQLRLKQAQEIWRPGFSMRTNHLIGRAVQQLVTKHLFAYSADNPNKMGGKRTHYVAGMAKAVNRPEALKPTLKGVTISIAQEGARLRIEGGTVVPVNKKYLTIPAIVEAYGKRASEFNNLSLMFRRVQGVVRAVALVENMATPIKIVRKGGRKEVQAAIGDEDWIGETGGRVVFWLVRSANIPANRALLPTNQQIVTTALETMNKAMRLQMTLWAPKK